MLRSEEHSTNFKCSEYLRYVVARFGRRHSHTFEGRARSRHFCGRRTGHVVLQIFSNPFTVSDTITREEICHYWPRVTTHWAIGVLTYRARPFTARPNVIDSSDCRQTQRGSYWILSSLPRYIEAQVSEPVMHLLWNWSLYLLMLDPATSPLGRQSK